MSKSILFIFFCLAFNAFAPGSSASSSSASATSVVADLEATQAALERQRALQRSLDEARATLERERALKTSVDKAKAQEIKATELYSRLQGLLSDKNSGIRALLKNTDDKFNAKQFDAFRSNYVTVCDGIKGIAECVESPVVGDLGCDVNRAGTKAFRPDFERMCRVIEKALTTQKPLMTAVKKRVKEAEKQMKEFGQEVLDVKKAEETIHAKKREEKTENRDKAKAAAAERAEEEERRREELESQKKYSRLREHAEQFFDAEVARTIRVPEHVTAICNDATHDLCVNAERMGLEGGASWWAEVAAQDPAFISLCRDALSAARNAYLALLTSDTRAAIRGRRGFCWVALTELCVDQTYIMYGKEIRLRRCLEFLYHDSMPYIVLLHEGDRVCNELLAVKNYNAFKGVMDAHLQAMQSAVDASRERIGSVYVSLYKRVDSALIKRATEMGIQWNQSLLEYYQHQARKVLEDCVAVMSVSDFDDKIHSKLSAGCATLDERVRKMLFDARYGSALRPIFRFYEREFLSVMVSRDTKLRDFDDESFERALEECIGEHA